LHRRNDPGLHPTPPRTQRTSLLLRQVALLFVLLGLLSSRVQAQECPQGRISYVFIDNRSIFDTAGLEPDAKFRWAYRFANAVHIETRREFLERELLFQQGDCLDPLLLEETERLLREYRFIARSDVFAVPQPDGSQHVVVDTQDEWTTRLDLGVRVENGFDLTGVGVAEDNFLGRGMRVRFFFQEDKERRDMGVEFQTPRILNTRWDARVAGGQTRSGTFFEESLFYPFVGEVGRFGGRQSFLRRETLFSYSLGQDPEYTHLLLPFLDERWDLIAGGRLGEPGNLIVYGAGFSMESIRFQEAPYDSELVRENDYSETVPGDPQHIYGLTNQIETRRANRFSLFLGHRKVRFVQRRGLDAFKGIQDVQVGTEVFFGIGRAWVVTGEDGKALPDDTHAQFSLFAGKVWEDWTLNAGLRAEGRYVHPFQDLDRDLRDIFAEADAYLYWQPRQGGPHTALFRLSAVAGWDVHAPYQLTLGGKEALRGYREEDFPGGRRVVMTLEDRIYLPWPAPELFDFGLALFVDVGHIQSGEVPYGVNPGWRASVGAGIRFGLPPGTGNMARIDIAAPLGAKTQFKDLVVRLNLQELLGLLPGVRDRQLLRSLRNGVRPTIITLPW
jgi:hypothetical protein